MKCAAKSCTPHTAFRIVKNEASSLEVVLRGIMPHMDSWYMMDTGSTDGTQDLIRTWLHLLLAALTPAVTSGGI
jgi:hypothetical protein